MRNFVKILCMLLVMVFVLSACGAETTDTDTQDQGNGNTQTDDTTKPDGSDTQGSDGKTDEEKKPNADAGITMDEAATLTVGATKDLACEFVPEYDDDDTTLTLTSSNEAVATVSGKTVTAVATGYAVITAANSDGSYTASCAVTVFGEKTEITVAYDTKSETKDITADPAKGAAIAFGGNFATGKKITVTMPAGHKYLAITVGTGVKEAIVYVPGETYEYTVPGTLNAIYPSGFATGAKVSVRIPTAAELTTTYNLALNPYDTTAKKVSGYPHVDCNNQYNTTEFAARCAIDGFTTNTGHGWFPQQSWGPNSTVAKSDYFTVDFGRTVVVDELVVYLRGDFGHDAYYSAIFVQFLNAEGKLVKTVKVNPTMIRDGQSFAIDGIEAASIKLTGFEIDSSKGGPWTGLAELEVKGTDKI